MKNKHLTHKDRVLIEDLLNRGTANLTTIGKAIGKDPSTIAKEIKKHITITNVRKDKEIKQCVKKANCTIKNLGCSNCRHNAGYLCSHCSKCEFVCEEIEYVCPKRKKPPYVCNGCPKHKTCSFEKGYYKSNIAQEQYEKEWSESRALISLNNPHTYTLDEIIVAGLNKGQSIHHIYEANKQQIQVCEKTLYNMVHQEIFSVSLLDLPRTAQRKIPKQYKYKKAKDKVILEGRTYVDFKNYSQNTPHEVLQLDTVIGNPSGSALVTMEFTASKLLLAFLIKERTMHCVSQVFYYIRQRLGNLNISQADIMPIILTDNGTEFNKPSLIECDEDGVIQSKLFYCNPNASYQKGELENNHTNLRRILPKGTSFDHLTQEQINMAVSHVNSLIRSSCMNKSAYEMFCFMHPNGKEILDALGIQYIKPNDVILKPSVLWLK